MLGSANREMADATSSEHLSPWSQEGEGVGEGFSMRPRLLKSLDLLLRDLESCQKYYQ